MHPRRVFCLHVCFTVQIACMLACRLLGVAETPLSMLPRYSRPEFRRPRYIEYKATLASRMHTLRTAWMLRAVLAVVTFFYQDGAECVVKHGLACFYHDASDSISTVLLQVCYAAAMLVLPVVSGFIAAYSVCQWSLRDY